MPSVPKARVEGLVDTGGFLGGGWRGGVGAPFELLREVFPDQIPDGDSHEHAEELGLPVTKQELTDRVH